MTTYERLRRILIDDYFMPADSLGAQTALADLGVDSLGMIELLCRVEHDFRIVTPPEQVRLATIADIVGFIDRLSTGEALVEPVPQTADTRWVRDAARAHGRMPALARAGHGFKAGRSNPFILGGARAAPVAHTA